jgi:hypothetical protein
MRMIVAATFLTLGVFTLPQQSTQTFPIPTDMRQDWPGAKLNNAKMKLLKKAVNPDLASLNQGTAPEEILTFDRVDTAEIALGTLGDAVVAIFSHSISCGTGGCPIYVYAREKDRYRRVLRDDLGWAYTSVRSKTAIPDLVIASNGGGGHLMLTLYRYDGAIYKRNVCEILIAKDEGFPDSWWDPSQVNIAPCTIIPETQ